MTLLTGHHSALLVSFVVPINSKVWYEAYFDRGLLEAIDIEFWHHVRAKQVNKRLIFLLTYSNLLIPSFRADRYALSRISYG